MTARVSRTTPRRVQPEHGPPLVRAEDLDDRRLLRRLLSRTTNPAKTADRLLTRFGSLGSVLSADAPELVRWGVADADAVYDLQVVRELAVRLARTDACRRPVVTSWTALQAYVRAALAHRPREQFRVLYLDHRNNLMQDEMVGDGTVDHAPVYPREVVRRALEISASAMVLVHNHPSGDPTPSQADIAMTRKVVDAAQALGLQVHDHIVVSRDGTASFRSLGLM